MHGFFYSLNRISREQAYGFASLSEKTRKSNHLQMLEQRQHLLNYFKTLSVGPARNRTRASRTIDWRLNCHKCIFKGFLYLLLSPTCARSVYFQLLWRATSLTNISISGIKLFFSFFRTFYDHAQYLFLIVLSGPQDSMRSV